MSIAALSAMYLLGTYGAEGNIYNDEEKNIVLMAWSVGIGSLLIPAFWKLVVIRNQMKREAEFGPDIESEESADLPLTEASSLWVVVGVLVTSLNSAVCVAGAVTLDDFYTSLTRMTLPLVILFYVVALFCQPRRNSPKDMWRLRLHFISFAWICEAATIVWSFRVGDSTSAAIHIVLAAAYTLGFHLGLKLRATVGRLPEKGETREPRSKVLYPLQRLSLTPFKTPKLRRSRQFLANAVQRRCSNPNFYPLLDLQDDNLRVRERIFRRMWKHCFLFDDDFSLPPFLVGNTVSPGEREERVEEGPELIY
jgi:hypothetical protein